MAGNGHQPTRWGDGGLELCGLQGVWEQLPLALLAQTHTRQGFAPATARARPRHSGVGVEHAIRTAMVERAAADTHANVALFFFYYF